MLACAGLHLLALSALQCVWFSVMNLADKFFEMERAQALQVRTRRAVNCPPRVVIMQV
jgi:hypothetical protein